MTSLAAAKLSGDIELVYTDYSAKDDGKEVRSLSTFAQNYSVYYGKTGFIKDPRFGTYNIGLGYQWTANSTTVSSENNILGKGSDSLEGKSSDSLEGKILFRGMVKIAPGALPIYFDAYSYDDTRPAYTYTGTGEILEANIIVGSRSREAIHSGMSLIAGIRNGSYLGAYRSLLSKFPRIFIDYHQVYIRDTGGVIINQHTLGRDLAFVSLNKKDNWFHYRAYDFKDYNQPENNYFTHTILLGTIDQRLKRQWINLTNWIKISVDASYTEEKSEDRIEFGADPNTYSMNYFTVADHGKTRISNFTNFTRTVDSEKLEHDYEIPFYANGWIDPNRSWSMQLKRYSRSEDWFKKELTRAEEDEGEYLAGQLGIGHTRPIKFDSSLQIERTNRNINETYAVRARNEISHNMVAGGRNPWLLGHAALYVGSSGDDGTNDIYENELYGSYLIAMSPRNSLEFTQAFRHANAVGYKSTRHISGAKGYPGNYNDKSLSNSSNDLYASETSLSLESRLKAKLTNRVTFVSNIYNGGTGDRKDLSIVDRLIYQSNRWRFDMNNGLYFGDDPPTFFTTRNIIIPGTKRQGSRQKYDVNYILGHSSELQYYPNQNFKTNAKFSFAIEDTDQGKVYQTSIDEKSEYTFLSPSNRRRAIARVYQALEYERYSNDFVNADYLEFTLGTSYYPFSVLKLGGEIIYSAWEPQGSSNIMFSTMAALTFSELSCEARYSYGVGQVSDGLIDERKEHLFEAKVRKSF